MLLTVIQKQNGRVISRHCNGSTLDACKEDFIAICINDLGLKLEGKFDDNFEIISKK